MLYVPGNFLFVHVPRTAGTSIKMSIASHLVSIHCDFTMSSASVTVPPALEKHATADQLRTVIKDYDRLFVWAVSRPQDEIIESDYRLHQSEIPLLRDGRIDGPWAESVAESDGESLHAFRKRRWEAWLGGETIEDRWLDDRVVTFEFSELRVRWKEILRECRIDDRVPLLHLNHGTRSKWNRG